MHFIFILFSLPFVYFVDHKKNKFDVTFVLDDDNIYWMIWIHVQASTHRILHPAPTLLNLDSIYGVQSGVKGITSAMDRCIRKVPV